jgi:hypothetical protein
MKTPLFYLALSIIVGIVIRAYGLPIVLRMARVRHWIYMKLGSEEEKERNEEILANIPDEIELYRRGGDQNDVIASKILLHLMMELPADILSWVPFVPDSFVDKIIEWGNALQHYRIPTAMIAGVATLGLMNYSFFISPANQTWLIKLVANLVIIAFIALVWKLKHPIARRIFYSWMGISMAVGVGTIVWITIRYHLYEILTFKIFLFAIIAVLPIIIVVDKSLRHRIFKDNWWLIATCWAGTVVASFGGTFVIAYSVKPLLEVLAAMGILLAGMFLIFGAITFMAWALCLLGVKGSAVGLRLLASGIRRLR